MNPVLEENDKAPGEEIPDIFGTEVTFSSGGFSFSLVCNRQNRTLLSHEKAKPIE